MTIKPAPGMFSFDLTGTIADIDGISHMQRICRLSPLPPDDVRRVLHEHMHLKTLSSPTDLTDTLIASTCDALRIDPADFPYGTQPIAPYRLRPDARMAIATAAQHLPTIVIANISVFAEPELHPVRTGLAPHLAAIHSSCAMGYAKPDPHAFTTAVSDHQLTVGNLIHISASWQRDIAPVLALGGRAVWLNHHRTQIPGSQAVPPGSLLVADSLGEAVEHAITRWLSRPPRPTPVSGHSTR